MRKISINSVFISLFISILVSSIAHSDSGGILIPQQAAYDVKFYDLDLAIHPDERTISGSVLVKVEIVEVLDSLILDLDDVFTISSIILKDDSHGPAEAPFLHMAGKIVIDIPWDVMIGDIISATIFYQGPPKISGHPPWDDGFIWSETSSGNYWIGVACETGGGDIWWPCKDHPSDEPDSVALHFTVPMDLTCVSNGIFLGSHRNGIDAITFDWFVSSPINNYNVTFYIANYKEIEDFYESVNGKPIPFYFWVLPEAYDAAQSHLPVFLNEFKFLELMCGPFPFITEKHGFAHSPYVGMEHQTIIAYGSDFGVNSWGMDYIHLHELAHEWWGNLVTAKDWSDIWIHEGLATYMEALYVEYMSGGEKYHQYMDQRRPGNGHVFPLAPLSTMTASEAFGALNPYYRGAWVMHTLRHHIGDEDFFSLLKHWAYPDTSDTDNKNGRLCRLATTEDMKVIAEQVTSRDLDPFFDVFLREISYPYIEVEYLQSEARLTWVTENDILLDVNVPVSVNGSPQIVEMNEGQGSISLPPQTELIIDPEHWILMDTPVITTVQNHSLASTAISFQLYQNFPNPFNSETNIGFSLPTTSNVKISIYNLSGEFLSEIFAGKKDAGTYWIMWNAVDYPSGVYFLRFQAENFSQTIKATLIN